MGNYLLTLGAIGTVALGTLFGLWRGALEERDAAIETKDAYVARLDDALAANKEWVDKYIDLKDEFTDVAVEGALSAQRETDARRQANSANIQLRQIRSKENETLEACAGVVVRNASDQRLRNDEFRAVANSYTGGDGSSTSVDPIRLSDSPGPMFSGTGNGIDSPPIE